MKKTIKKQQSEPVQKVSYRFGVIYFSQEGENSYPLLEALIQSNRDYTILVTGPVSDAIQKWTDTGKVWVCSPAELRSIIQASEAEFWLSADASTRWNIQRTVQNFRPEGAEELYFPGTVKNESGKPGLGQWLSVLSFKKVSAFFSPSTRRHSVWKSAIIRKDALVSLLSTFSPSSLDAFFHRLNLMDISSGEFELTTQNNAQYGKEAGKSFKTGIKSYFSWFYTEALREFKNRELGFSRRIQGLSRLLFVSIFLACLIGMPILSKDYGISWDEKLQYEYAHDIYAYLTSFGEDKTIFDFENKSGLWQPMQYYGSFFDVLTVAVVDIFSIENEFEARHVLNAIFGVIGLLFAGLIARAITKNWLTALLALVLLLLTPSYFGHSMNNPKDIPFATGFYMSMYFMILFIRQLPRPTFATVLLLILSIGLSVSIRVGGILIYPYILLFGGVKWLGAWKTAGVSNAFRQLPSYFMYFVIVLIGGWLVGIVFWPYALQDPINNPLAALKGLSNVNYTTSYETFEGVRTYMSKVPWYYSLKLIALGAPLIILLGALIQLFRVPFSWRKQSAWVGMLLFMLFFPPLYAAYKESMLYNGWRHWFFVYVNLVVLAAWGLTWIIENRLVWLRYAGLALLFLGCGNVIWWMVRSHPNQYVYFNELTGGLKGAYGYYETDYYSNTIKQAVDWFVNNVDIKSKKIKILTNNEPLTAQYYFNKYGDSVEVEWTREYELSKEHGDYAIFTTRTMAKTTLLEGHFPPRGTVHVIEQDGVPLCAIIKRENQYIPDGYAAVDANRYPEALQLFKQAAAYDSTNDELWRMMGLAYANLGPAYIDSAIRALHTSIAVQPENFLAYDILGSIYAGMNRHDTAISLYKRSISYKINHTNAHYNMGISLYNLQKFDQAALAFENCIRYGGQKPQFYKLYGASLANLNRFDEAIQYLNYAAENSNDPEAYVYLAAAYRMKGDENAALKVEQKARQLQGQ